MFSGDPDHPDTWFAYVFTILIAICIYFIFHQRHDIALILGFENAPTTNHTTSSDERIPILTTDDCDLIYSNAHPSRRIDNLILSFTKKFVNQHPDFIIRAPGRVNLIGEHIDYCGYNVLPMAIEKDILFAVKIVDPNTEQNIIRLCNRESSKFSAIQIDLSSKQDTQIALGAGAQHSHWSHYFIAAFHGFCDYYSDKIRDKNAFKSLQIMVDGNIPKGSGLSSSSALVCGSAMSLLYANLSPSDFHNVTKSEIATICMECERHLGVDSGGMDQTICMTANRGYAKYIRFRPELKGTDIKLPPQSKVRWVISNCLKEHKLQNEEGTANYNTRVVECRLAALVLAKLLGLRQWRSVLQLSDIQDMTRMELDQLLFRSMDLLNTASYSIEQIEDELECEELGITLEELMVGLKRGKAVLSNLRSNDRYRAPLQQRALHVYGEATRVLRFRDICKENYDDEEEDEEKLRMDDKIVRKLGKLMCDSHLSCRDKYECSCEELDELQSLCMEGGALGSRLTGAGWGGCVVSLVEADKVNQFKAYLNKNYYASIPKVPLNHQFTTTASVGLVVLEIK